MSIETPLFQGQRKIGLVNMTICVIGTSTCLALTNGLFSAKNTIRVEL